MFRTLFLRHIPFLHVYSVALNQASVISHLNHSPAFGLLPLAPKPIGHPLLYILPWLPITFASKAFRCGPCLLGSHLSCHSSTTAHSPWSSLIKWSASLLCTPSLRIVPSILPVCHLLDFLCPRIRCTGSFVLIWMLLPQGSVPAL